MNTVFVYSKNGKIKVLDFQQAKVKHDDMIAQGWLHTATLNPCVFIEYLYNNQDDALKSIISLQNISK